MQNNHPQNPFDAWCWAHGYENSAVAVDLKVSAEQVRQWRLPLNHADFTRPSARRMEEIHAFTKGRVTPNHFFDLRGAPETPPSEQARAKGRTRPGIGGRGRTSAAGARTKAQPAAAFAGEG